MRLWAFKFLLVNLKGSITILKMSEFGKLLKNSKFASLAKPLRPVRDSIYPTHQVVETRKAALDRQEWGLKYALPSKIKSRYITFNNPDSEERMVDFETNGGDLWKRQRFEEMGLVPTLEGPGSNPLFYKRGSNSRQSVDSVLNLNQNAKKTEVQSLVSELSKLRSEFKECLLQSDPRSVSEKQFSATNFDAQTLVFLKDYKKKMNVNTLQSLKLSDARKIHGYGGLSYGLKGRLATDPNGVVQHQVVPGRYLAEQRVAVGGFIARTENPSNQFNNVISKGESREIVVPFQPSAAVINNDGSVRVEFKTISKPEKKNYRPKGAATEKINLSSQYHKYL